MARLVDCYYCGCPVEWDPDGKLEGEGITLEDVERGGLAVICNLCLDMAEVEPSARVETIHTAAELKTHLKD